MRTPSAKAKSAPSLRSVINATKKLWRQYHLSYDQTRYVSKEVRRALAIEQTKMRQRVIARLSRDEEERLIKHAYRMKGERGLLIKTLFQTGARVSEFVNIKTEDVFFEEQMILIAKAKGGKSRYVPILPELAQELRTHVGQRTVGYLFETNRATCYSPRRIQYIVNSILKFFQVDNVGMLRMTSSARYFKEGVGSRRPNWRWIMGFLEWPKANTWWKACVKRCSCS
jgi:integrase/recombinase XerD